MDILLMGPQVESIVDSMAGSLKKCEEALVAFLEILGVMIAFRDHRLKISFIKKSALGLIHSSARILMKTKPDSHVVETNLAFRGGNAQSHIALRMPDPNLNRTIPTMSFSLHYLDLLSRQIRVRG